MSHKKTVVLIAKHLFLALFLCLLAVIFFAAQCLVL